MGSSFTIKQGDLLPAIAVQLTDDNGPVNLTGATQVLFRMRKIPQCWRPGYSGPDTQAPVNPQIQGQASVTNAAQGDVSYGWNAGDTAVPGQYRAEFVVYWGSDPVTFPTSGYVPVTINPAS